VPIRYDAQYWSLVFPLGMYSVATRAYTRDQDLAFLYSIAGFAADAALVAWTLTAIGLAWRVIDRRAEASAKR
jgi:tellurite resistance protein TehA-like permease